MGFMDGIATPGRNDLGIRDVTRCWTLQWQAWGCDAEIVANVWLECFIDDKVGRELEVHCRFWKKAYIGERQETIQNPKQLAETTISNHAMKIHLPPSQN
eukprot:scaffold2243_cov73-Cyclotella_meneghiniana.AAC.12